MRKLDIQHYNWNISFRHGYKSKTKKFRIVSNFIFFIYMIILKYN